jgi:hypothetical protein
MKRIVRTAATTLLATVLVAQSAMAGKVEIYDPISAGGTVTLVAGEVDGSTEGDGVTEGTSNSENTVASQNSRVSQQLTNLRQKLIDDSELIGDLLIKGDSYVVNTYTYYVDTYDLEDYVMKAEGYETVTGLLPTQRFQREVDIEAVVERYTELVAAGQKIYEEMLEVGGLDDIDWEDMPELPDEIDSLDKFITLFIKTYKDLPVPPPLTTDDPDGETHPGDNIPAAVERLLEKVQSGNLRKGDTGLPDPIIVTEETGGDKPKPPKLEEDPEKEEVITPIKILLPKMPKLPGLPELPDEIIPELPTLEIEMFKGDIEYIEMELERVLEYILHEEYTYWNEDLLVEWQIPIVDIINGQIKVNEGAVGLEYERKDLIPGGIIDARTLESRFRLLDIYLQHISTAEQINTRVITEYRVTGENQSQVIEKVPTNTWVWTVEDESGGLVAGPIYTQGRYLQFVFNSAGTYRILANQIMTVVRADVVSYDKNEYWVLNNGDAFDGLVIYRDHKQGMTYRTNVTQEEEEVPVSDILQDVTPDMVGFAFIAGPGSGLVGVQPGINTQRYK